MRYCPLSSAASLLIHSHLVEHVDVAIGCRFVGRDNDGISNVDALEKKQQLQILDIYTEVLLTSLRALRLIMCISYFHSVYFLCNCSSS